MYVNIKGHLIKKYSKHLYNYKPVLELKQLCIYLIHYLLLHPLLNLVLLQPSRQKGQKKNPRFQLPQVTKIVGTMYWAFGL